MRTKNKGRIIFGEAVKECAAVYSGSFRNAFLYGSYARGDYTDESDVDILLVVDTNAEGIKLHRAEISRISSDLSLKYDITVSITVKPSEQFDRFSDILPFYKNVVSEGVRYAV